MVRCILSAALMAAASTVFVAGETNPEAPRTVPGAYIVEFAEDANMRQFRVQAEPAYTTRVELNFELFQGISIQLDDVDTAEERAAQLASLPAVKNIWPITVVNPPAPIFYDDARFTLDSTEQGLRKRQSNGTVISNANVVMTQIDKLHARGITGEGITIAFIDSGVDYNHPALCGCFGQGCLVAKGYDLVGDDYFGGTSTPVPDDDPNDCMGHGTHVAGIIAGQENPYFVGAAPGVTLAAYRVFGCGGGASDDILIAAYNRAYEDGADIISTSAGMASGWPSAPWALAASRIVEKGVPCIVSAGNDGRGLFDASSPATGHGVTSVASFDSPHIPMILPLATYTIDDGPAQTYRWRMGSQVNFDGTEREMWVTGYNLTNDRDACFPLPDDTPDLSEYFVLIRRSVCTDHTLAINLIAKGARYMGVYNDRPGVPFIDLRYFEDTQDIIGTFGVSQEQGEAWVKAMESGSVVKTIFTNHEDTRTDLILLENEVSPGALSSYTSWGPAADMSFYPDLGAPGGYIMSTYPRGNYVGSSGTSMAAPLVSASYALIAQARKTKPSPALFEQLLSSTAKAQLFSWNGPFQDWLATPAQQGAGLVQVYDAAYTSSYLEPPSLSFNDTANFAGTLNFTIINIGDEEATYNITHAPTHTLYTLAEDRLTSQNGIASINAGLVTQHAELEFSTTKVTVAAGGSAVIAVTVTPPIGLDENRYPFWSGYVVVNGTDDTSLSLPYQGLSGSLHEATVMEEGGRGIVLFDYSTYDRVPANTKFTLPYPGEWRTDLTLPYFEITTQWGSPHISADVVPLTTCPPNSTVTTHGVASIGQLLEYPVYFAPRELKSYLWLGDLNDGRFAPAGRYKIVFRVLRIFGDPSDEDDWIVNESIPLVIEYAEPE